MKTRPALTLVELLLVMALIIIVSIPALISVPNIRNRQALKATGENLANVMRTARIYSRGEKDDKAWGIRYRDSSSYQLIAGKPESYTVVKTYTTEKPVVFAGESSFPDIWFERISGDTGSERLIEIEVGNQMQASVFVTTTGIIKYSCE